MGVHVAGTQHGHTYYLGPLEGTRAPALVALRSRAPAANVDFWPLQHTIWQIEGGLSYNDMSADSQQLIDRLIPEYKGQLRDNFVKSMQKSCGGILGRFAGSLCNEANALNERYQQVQQTLQRYANNYEALGQQIVHVIPGEYQNPGPASWSRLSPRVYARVAGGHIWQEMSTLEIRVLPRSGVANATTSSPPASFHNVSYSLTGNPEAGIGNDTAEVPIGAVIAYPDSGAGVQVLGPNPVGGGSPPPSGSNLAVRIVPVNGTYMLLGPTELASLQQMLLTQLQQQGLTTSGTWLGAGVATNSLFSTSYTKLADLLLQLPTDVTDAASAYDELGTMGLGLDWISKLTSLNLQTPPDIVVNTANSEIAAVTKAQENLLQNHSCMSSTGAQYTPFYIVGPGQYLVVLATGLNGSSAKLDLANIPYGFSIGLGECGKYPTTSVGFQVTDVTLSQTVLSNNGTAGCPSVAAAMFSGGGNAVTNLSVPLPCSNTGSNSAKQPSPITRPSAELPVERDADDTSPGKTTGAKIVKAMIQEQATSLELPLGQMYLYGMTTGGGVPSSGLTTGQYAQVVNAAGKLSATLAYGTNSRNSYSTQAAYHDIGGVSVAGSWEHFAAYYGSNRQTGAHDASVSFQANEDSLVVVLGLASSQQFVSVEGIPNLEVDASRNGGGMVIAHAYVKPGTYNVIEYSKVLAAGQDPAHMADLVGVFVFGGSQPSNQAVAASELPRAAGTKGSIRSVDFRNFDYPYDKPGEVIHVSNGKWDKVVANAQENYEEHYAVGKVIYGDLIGDGHEEAAVLTSDWGAANFQFAHILVYAMSSMGPSLLQELEQSSSAKGNDIDWTRVRDVRIANRELLIVADEGQCHACTDWIVTAKYQWNGKLFVRTALLRKPVQK